MLGVVVLVVLFGLVERACGHHLSGDLPATKAVGKPQLVDVFLGLLGLLITDGEDGRGSGPGD